MKRLVLATAAACAGVLALASPCSAYTPPETDPRIVITTSQGTILVALAPENAPKHVEEFIKALAGGDFEGAGVARVSPKFYVQLVGRLSEAQLAGLPVERLKVGNVHGAMSLYDSGNARRDSDVDVRARHQSATRRGLHLDRVRRGRDGRRREDRQDPDHG